MVNGAGADPPTKSGSIAASLRVTVATATHFFAGGGPMSAAGSTLRLLGHSRTHFRI